MHPRNAWGIVQPGSALGHPTRERACHRVEDQLPAAHAAQPIVREHDPARFSGRAFRVGMVVSKAYSGLLMSQQDPSTPTLTPNDFTSIGRGVRSRANRFALDYRTEAAGFANPRPIIDCHAHINGPRAMLVYRDVARTFAISRATTQVSIVDAPRVRDTLGDFIRFIAFPNFRTQDRRLAMTEAYLADIQAFRELGAGFVKLWNAPRMRELFPGEGGRDLTELDGEWRLRHARLAESLGMGIMVHVADPDTWFASRYADANRYGKKIDHYRGFRSLMDQVPVPFIAAHMGGWPEDLDFLDLLLTGHQNLHLDTSATKWVVRALSSHAPARVVDFFTRWRTRLLFGSDIVTLDDHLTPSPAAAPIAPPPADADAATLAAHAAKVAAAKHPMADLADSPEAAFDLYASRYFALRLMFETGYRGESPIADPDLMMVDPTHHNDMSAPPLNGLALAPEILDDLYFRNAQRVFASVGCPL